MKNKEKKNISFSCIIFTNTIPHYREFLKFLVLIHFSFHLNPFELNLAFKLINLDFS